MRRLVYIPTFLFVLLLSGCAEFANVPVPETPRERLVVLEISHQAANRSIQDLVAAGTLYGEAASQVADLLEVVQVAMRAARVGVDDANGLELLDAANKALIALTARLRAEESYGP